MTNTILPTKSFRRSVCIFSLLALCLAAFVGIANAAATKKIAYTLNYEMAGENPRLVVTLVFDGDDSGRTALSLPMDWGGEGNFGAALSDFKCLSRECQIEPSRTATALFVDHRPGPVAVQYTVKQDWQGPYRDEVRYRPYLDENSVFLIGHAFLVTPDNYQGHPVELSLDWLGVPGDWAKLTSFGTGSKVKTVVGDLDALRSAIYTAGDYRVLGDEIRGVYTFAAVRGAWPFGDRDFADLTFAIIRNIRGFWNDYNAAQYLVTLNPVAGECCSYGGTSLADSFALFVTEDKADLKQFEYLLSHELLHQWIGTGLHLDGPEEYGYWFTEGFTDFYSRLLRLRGGQMTLKDYAEDYNAKIADYYLSPARNGTFEDVKEKFWQDREFEKLPYRQGDILAHNWNAGIKEGHRDNTSLDTVMKAMMAEGGGEFTLEEFDAAIRGQLGRSIRPEIEDLKAGKTLDLGHGALGACFALKEVAIAKYDRGFTYRDSDKEDVFFVVESVNENHNAYEAGVRPGDEIVGYTLSGRGDVPLKLQIRRGDKTVEVEYLPEGEKLDVPQYVLDEKEYRKHPERCLAWFLGN